MTVTEQEVLDPETQANDALVLVQAQPIEKLFESKTIAPILEKIALHVRQVPRDISTELGRKALAALAFKITKTKTFIEDQRLALVSSEKKRLSLIDSEGKRIRDTLESLRDEIRGPLTDWENEQKGRVARCEADILELARTDLPQTTADARARLEWLRSYDIASLAEFAERGDAIRRQSIEFFERLLARCMKDDDDRKELEARRAEDRKREQETRDKEIADRARADAEAKAQEADNRAKRAEEGKRVAEAKAKADSEAAVERERRRVEDAKKAEAAELAKREKDRKHRAAIHNAALEAFVAGGINRNSAKAVVELIAKGKIPRVKVEY